MAAAKTIQIALQNHTSSDHVYAYITGQAIDDNNALVLIKSDAHTPYFPPNPSRTGAPINANIAIPLGAPGHTVTATVPQIAGGRIWVSVGAELVFALNPGPGLVEPSVFNPADPNHDTNFGFCEFTFNSAQLFCNISMVDFVGTPIALTLKDTSNHEQHVSGLPADGIQTIADGLSEQTKKDGHQWDSLLVRNKADHLVRILSPNSGITLNPSWFKGYWTDYVNEVYSKYTKDQLTVDTQASWGDVKGQVGSSGCLGFGSGGELAKPSSADIFGCSTGPFATGGNAETNTIIPRVAAAFNRSTLLLSDKTPNGTNRSQYYKHPTTNHYARMVHATTRDGTGYSFPYDDVTPDGGKAQEGAVISSNPRLLTVAVGGRNASK